MGASCGASCLLITRERFHLDLRSPRNANRKSYRASRTQLSTMTESARSRVPVIFDFGPRWRRGGYHSHTGFVCRDDRHFLRIAATIKRRYRSGTDSRLRSVTFREFVQYIIDPRTGRPLDRHWRPFHQLCQPCRFHYNFIGLLSSYSCYVN